MFRTSAFSRVIVLGAALGAGTLLAPHQAFAQTSAAETQRVTELFKSGKAAFAKGNMDEAERLFAEAFALRQSSDIAANLGQSQLEQEKYRAAAEHFQWALANLLPSATDAQRKAVETGLARARAEVGILRLDIKPDGSDVLVGEQNLGKSPVAASVYVDPGEVIISVRHDGFVTVDKRVMVGKGTEQAVDVALTPKDGAALASDPATPAVDSGLALHDTSHDDSARADRGPHRSLVPAFIATGVAVAGGVTGLVFTLSASSKASDADKLRDDLNAMGGCGGGASDSDCASLKDQRKSVDSSRNIAIGAFVAGGVSAVVAGFFYWHALSHHSSAHAGELRPLLGLRPSVDIGRTPGGDAASIGSVKLSLSGNF
jgi:tetratricopeptide (TPR) repeat protein